MFPIRPSRNKLQQKWPTACHHTLSDNMSNDSKVQQDWKLLHLALTDRKQFCHTTCALEHSVSRFMVRTCRILQKANTDVFDYRTLPYTARLPQYLILSGSCAEFYIQPYRPCIDDVDCLRVGSNLLAFIDETPKLPSDVRLFSDEVDCYLMEPDLDYPAFIRFRFLGQIKYNWTCKAHEFIHRDDFDSPLMTELDFIGTDATDERWEDVGPANRGILFNSLCADIVVSIWCPQWPNNAKNWPKRQRKYGWPTSEIIHEVVQNGCHAVRAEHPACKKGGDQWRLSFSVAEVILLHSWTPIQQIVYHLLRFFSKRELIKKVCLREDKVLCTYHFKTLMLWSCEDMPPELWDSVSVMRICSNLLSKLSGWLKETRCPNYFIPGANLFYEHFNRNIVNEIIEKLIYFSDSEILSLWFVVHYMQLSIPFVFDANFPGDICSSVYEHMLHTCEVMKGDNPKAISLSVSSWFCADVECAYDRVREKSLLDISFIDFCKYFILIGSLFENKSDIWPAAEIESCYRMYGSVLRTLHAACLLDCKELRYDNKWFVEEIQQVFTKRKRLMSKYHTLPLRTDDNRSRTHFTEAQELMQNLIGSNGDQEFQAVSEISYSLLMKSLECNDSATEKSIRATLAYMAALQFAKSEDQMVVDLCSRVILGEKQEKEDVETLNAVCLLYIDDTTTIIGFYLIFRKTRCPSLQFARMPVFLDLRLTPEVFAYHLRNLSFERIHGTFHLNAIAQTPQFPLDAILMAINNRNCSRVSEHGNSLLCQRVYQRTYPVNNCGALPHERCSSTEDKIIQLLTEYSLMQLENLYKAIWKNLDIHWNPVEVYRASYLYKLRKYPEVLHICEIILDEQDLSKNLTELTISNAMAFPPFDSYFDRDVQCLLGFNSLFYYLSPVRENSPTATCTCTQRSFFDQNIHSDKCLLSIFLDDRNIMKYRNSLGRQFLARYLKMRCLIDCCKPLSDSVVEFKRLHISLPFEYIVQGFLQFKLRQLSKGVNAK